MFSLKAHLVFVTKYRKLFEDDELRKHYYKEHTFWSDDYFVCSIGEGVSYETI